MSAIAKAVAKIGTWWGLRIGSRVILCSLADDDMARVVGISVGLGDLFSDDVEAERAWLNRPREELDGRSALAFMLARGGSGVRAVDELVNEARNLK